MRNRPHLLLDRSKAQECLRPLLDIVPLSDAAKDDVCERMSGADRVYHGVDHLALLWQRHELYATAAGLRRPDIDRLIASTIAYHDAIYVPGRQDNEARSAELWLQSSGGAISEPERSWVAETIRATKNHLAYAPEIGEANADFPIEQRARLWMLDLDLSPIGEKPKIFDMNAELLRDECRRVSDEDFEDDRLVFLRQLNASPRIYRSPVLAAAFEKPARRNLRRYLFGKS